MRNKLILFLLLFFTSSLCFGQNTIKSECEDLMLWFQGRFENTQDYESSKILNKGLDDRLDPLIEKYGQREVADTVSSIAKEDKRFIPSVSEIILNHLKSKEETFLALSIKSDKSIYNIGEEIKLLVTLENNSDKELIIYWPESSPAMARRKGTNAFTIFIDASRATEFIYIKPKETLEKYISINLTTNLISGACNIIMEYTPIGQLGHKINIEKQKIWNAPLTSNTIQIEVKGKEK